MLSSTLRAGIVSLLALLLLHGTRLDAGQLTPNAYAVLVGVDTYPDKKIKPRKHAEADVKALYDVIVAKEHLGADPKNVHLLLGKDGKTTRAAILAALDDVVAKAGPGDLVFFAFFGQGCPLGEQVGFFGTDATAANRSKTALDGSEIAKKLEGLKATRFCAFVDVNLTDFENSKEAARELDLRGLSNIVLGDSESTTAKKPKGRVMFLASNGLSSTVQLDKHSLFAQTLLDGLKGEADKDGYEKDGVTLVDELVKHVDDELPRVARTVGKTKDEKSQVAIVLRNPPTDFALSRTPKVAPIAEKRLDRFAEIAKTANAPADVLAEGERLLTRMPRVKYQQELRKHYQALADGKVKMPELLKARAKIGEEIRLPRDDATDYAERIQAALDAIHDDYFKEKDRGELASGAVKGLYEFAGEPIPATLAERLRAAKGLGKGAVTDLLADAREGLHRREDLEKKKAEEAALKYLFTHHLDRYSAYIEAETVRRFKADTSGSFTGVGIQVRRDPVRDMLIVVTPIKDSPAYKLGVKTGDHIVQIKRDMDSEGKPYDKTEIINGAGLPLEDAIKKIVGKPGTKVRLVFDREGEAKPIEIEITRGKITAESLFGVKRNADDSWNYMLDDQNKIGYARIGSFQDNTAIELRKAITTLKKQGMKGFVLDLRFCPGGKLNTALTIGDMFIKDEMIVGIRYRGQPERKVMGTKLSSETEFPMDVLMNRFSASASELVTASWQDHKRVTVIGDRSFGKGTVVHYSEFVPTGGILNLTTATFWRPSGKNLEKIMTNGKEEEEWGVSPNEGFRIKLGRAEESDLFEHMRNQEIIARRDLKEKTPATPFKDVQLEKAIEHMREQTK